MESPSPYESIAATLEEELTDDCRAMLQHALGSGHEIPVEVLEVFARLSAVHGGRAEQLAALGMLHTLLVRLVAPATPLGIRVVQDDEHHHGALHLLGPVQSIRWLMLAAIFFSLSFFGISLSPMINHDTLSHDIYSLSGTIAIVPLLFLLSAAGMGATFGALFEAYQFVSERRFDARFASVYWARIALGLVAGLMLAELIPETTGAKLLERPLLALLGGFSGAQVHRILQRLVDGVENIFSADTKSPRSAEESAPDRARQIGVTERANFAHGLESLLAIMADSKSQGSVANGAKDGVVIASKD